jgi:hypothetical protein
MVYVLDLKHRSLHHSGNEVPGEFLLANVHRLCNPSLHRCPSTGHQPDTCHGTSRHTTMCKAHDISCLLLRVLIPTRTALPLGCWQPQADTQKFTISKPKVQRSTAPLRLCTNREPKKRQAQGIVLCTIWLPCLHLKPQLQGSPRLAGAAMRREPDSRTRTSPRVMSRLGCASTGKEKYMNVAVSLFHWLPQSYLRSAVAITSKLKAP